MPVKKKSAPAAKKSTAGAAKKAVKRAAAPAAKKAAVAKKAPVAKKSPAAVEKAPAAKKAPSARKAPAAKTARKTARPVAPKSRALTRKPKAVPTGETQRPDEGPGMALALAIADAADMKKAEQVRILDVRGLSMVTDFLVIASGSSAPHLRAIRNEVAERIREERQEKPYSTQGETESQWLLLDYGDVVVHLFQEEKRDLYALEDLWSDAPRIEWAPKI